MLLGDRRGQPHGPHLHTADPSHGPCRFSRLQSGSRKPRSATRPEGKSTPGTLFQDSNGQGPLNSASRLLGASPHSRSLAQLSAGQRSRCWMPTSQEGGEARPAHDPVPPSGSRAFTMPNPAPWFPLPENHHPARCSQQSQWRTRRHWKLLGIWAQDAKV